METLKLTEQDILKDIEGYQDRLNKAQAKLDAVPANGANPAKNRKLKIRRNKLRTQIQVAKLTVQLARDALMELERTN